MSEQMPIPEPSYATMWAAVIAGTFGFSGIIVGQIWNARQTRVTEQRLRENQRSVLRTSLWAELKSLAKVIKEEIEYVENQNNNFTWVPLIDSFKIYISNMPNLGLLTPDEVEKATVAYYAYQENAGYIARLAKDQPDKPAIGRHIEFDFTKTPEMRVDVLQSLSGALSPINSAIDSLAAELAKTDWFLKSKAP